MKEENEQNKIVKLIEPFGFLFLLVFCFTKGLIQKGSELAVL